MGPAKLMDDERWLREQMLTTDLFPYASVSPSFPGLVLCFELALLRFERFLFISVQHLEIWASGHGQIKKKAFQSHDMNIRWTC